MSLRKASAILCMFIVVSHLGINSIWGADPKCSAGCEFPDLDIPSTAKIFVVCAHAGKKSYSGRNDDSSQATYIRVTVNHPGEPVILMLGCHEENLWHVVADKDTKILAVVVSGVHQQSIRGLDRNIPVLISYPGSASCCPAFYSINNPEDTKLITDLSRKLFGKYPDGLFEATDGKVVIGSPPHSNEDAGQPTIIIKIDGEYASENMTASVPPAHIPPPGIDGLDEALAKEWIRFATKDDVLDWQAANVLNKLSHSGERDARAREMDAEHLEVVKRALTIIEISEPVDADKWKDTAKRDIENLRRMGAPAERVGDYNEKEIEDSVKKVNTEKRRHRSVYVVLSADFVIPGGLFGINASTFIIPENLSIPSGERAHNTFLIMKDGSVVIGPFKR